MLELKFVSAGSVDLVLAPEIGGAIARLDVNGKPVLRPWTGKTLEPFSFANNVLIPFSNRISGGGFYWNGEYYKLKPNIPEEDFPIHGDGFKRKWNFSAREKKIRMSLNNGSFGPWRYKAVQEFELSEKSLKINLVVTNKGSVTLPFGFGFHPWFPRSSDTRLTFSAEGLWLEDLQHLPTREISLEKGSVWEFSRMRPLPNTWINNCYTGWRGKARIKQGLDAVSCSISSSKNLNNAIIYSPNSKSSFFCFEPVSHPVDAFNLPFKPGLSEIGFEESLISSITISWS